MDQATDVWVDPKSDEHSPFVQGQRSVIIVLEPNADVSAVARDHGLQPGLIYTHAINGFVGSIVQSARAGLLKDHRVALVEEDAAVHTLENVQGNPPWGLDRIDQRDLPLDQAYTYRHTGQGVSAYIIDTGIRFDHVDFAGRAAPGADFVGDGRNGGDCGGHGTHVAGIVGGTTWGVAKDVRLVSVRVMDCEGAGTVSGVIAGIDWVIGNNNGPAVATLSLGAARNEALNQAVRNLVGAGVQVAIAAGNSNADACTISPASTAEAVTVGSAGTGERDDRYPSSNWGGCVDLFAPGAAIVSASHADPISAILRTGTSMAAPHAAGVMALWLEEDPALSPAQLHEMIIANATQNVVLDARSDNAHLLHSIRTIAAPPPPPPPPPPAAPPSAGFTASCLHLTCSFDASSSQSPDGTITEYVWAFGDGSFGNGKVASRTYAAAGTYFVTLQVKDHNGKWASKSVPVAPTAPPPPPVTRPAAPTDLGAGPRALNAVDLAWTDNSNNEQGFRVERRTGDGGYTLLAQVGANTTRYRDQTVEPGSTYTYRVVAFNQAGVSPPSNEASITVACLTMGKSVNC